MADIAVAPSGLFTKDLNLENPGASEDDPSIQLDEAAVISKLRAVLRGTTPSVTWTLRHGSDRNAAGTEVVTGGTTTTNTTTGETITSFNSASIPAGDHVWLETTAASGTVLSFRVTIVFNG